MPNLVYDCSGYATKNDIKCSDGRTIRRGAFQHCDGKTVPVVWQHDHHNPYNVLGHATLRHKDDGTYAYITFNGTDMGKTANELVHNGDIDSLSIYANKLKHKGSDVIYGDIKEVSLVLSGANPGARIDYVSMSHSDVTDDGEYEAEMFFGDQIELFHAESDEETSKSSEKEEKEMPSPNEKTVGDVFNELTEEQKKVVYYMIGQALEDAGVKGEDNGEAVEHSDLEEGEDMKYNVFEADEMRHADFIGEDDIRSIIDDAKKLGSMRDSVLAHADEYGIKDLEDYLFPDAKSLNTPPEFIKRETSWVDKVMGAVHRTPFSRIKSLFADITEDEARAKGYIKGKRKKEEVFTLLKRTTTPTTIYKKQKMDRDDIIDITDFDVMAWLKAEMRMMLDEEIARAILIGDGRSSADDDKIPELNIRPVYTDDDLFAVKVPVEVAANEDSQARARKFIRSVIRARKDYKGSGQPTLYTTEDMLTDMLLIEDLNQRVIYDSVDKLATALRVKEIVTVEVMEGVKRRVSGESTDRNLLGIVCNLTDYNVGADKGGAVNFFDDFDIDYNQMKYLIETRCSGALIKPYSALIIEEKQATA